MPLSYTSRISEAIILFLCERLPCPTNHIVQVLCCVVFCRQAPLTNGVDRLPNRTDRLGTDASLAVLVGVFVSAARLHFQVL